MVRQEWQSVPAMLVDSAERRGDDRAVVTDGGTLSYGGLLEAARRFAGGLVDAGVQPADRVAIWAPNSLEWVIAVLGLLYAGATLVPINTRFKGAEAADILGRSRARLLVTVTDFLGNDYVGMLDRTGIDLPDLETVVVARGPAPDDTRSWEDLLGSATDPACDRARSRAQAVGRDDPSDILFTSGATGVPKGVVMTHGCTVRVATDWVAMTGLAHEDRYLMVNPYFHLLGLKAGILACVAAGATMLPEPVFDVDRVLARVAAERVTVLPGPPALYQSILDHPRRGDHDLSSLRVAVTGAAHLPVELIHQVRHELAFSRVVAGYSLTEAGTATGTTPDDDDEAVATTVGRARPGFELRIVAGDGTDAPDGEPGEILLRGPSVMARYLDDPQATTAALSTDGWLRTADLGLLDDAGRLRLLGRVDDMFVVGGCTAYPAEIEKVLLRHPDVASAAVVGVADPRLGEVGMAFVVLRPHARTAGEDIVAWSREQMADYKVPRTVEVVDALPRNATGKVMKDALRARLRG